MESSEECILAEDVEIDEDSGVEVGDGVKSRVPEIGILERSDVSLRENGDDVGAREVWILVGRHQFRFG